jgi:hypothetical protein
MKAINESVSIKIQAGVYGQFRNLNNKVWFALGEYVDNAVQSFENNKDLLTNIHGSDFNLKIEIKIDRSKDLITIKDNAGGIGLDNYYRAFEPAHIPIDNTGLHEHGMGMKTASIWLSDIWIVKTKAIGEEEEREVEFNLEKVIDEKKELLFVKKTPKEKNEHYTEIYLSKLSNNAPSPHQIDKIKKHLASIYRNFIRSGELHLAINDELLEYEDPEILSAPYYKDLNGKNVLWKKEIDFSHGEYSVKGFVGILKQMSTSEQNGFSLFRRGRVIIGSHDEKYRPKSLCGQIGSPRYKRIFGEFELEGFGVSFNKGSFTEVDDLEALMEAIKLEISGKEFDLYNQAEKYIKPKSQEHNVQVAKKLIQAIKKTKNKDSNVNNESKIEVVSPQELVHQNEHSKEVQAIDSYKDKVELKGETYELQLQFITETSLNYLYILEIENNNLDITQVTYKINLAHSFFSRFERFKKESDYQPIVSIIKSLILAELISSSQGTTNAGNIRLNFNNFLNNV